MPHRLSLVRRTAELRRLYTRETDSTLLPTVTEGIRALSPDERGTISEVLDHGYETRLFGENPLPAPHQRLRDAVLPDATDAGQQQLEAGILFALGQIAPYHWPETEVVAPMPVCRIVRPHLGDQETVLHMNASAMTPMTAVLLPRLVDGRVHGLAGLRADLRRRHVQLLLADTDPTPRIGLAKTSFRQWAATLAFAEQMIAPEDLLILDDPMTAPEHASIRAGRVAGPVALASALLRRVRVLGDTFWLTVRADRPAGLRMDWAGGRTAVHVATALVHPLAGLAGDRFYVTRLDDGSVTIIITSACGEPTAKLTLHQALLTAPPPFTPVDVSAAWTGFKCVMAEPNPALPKRELAKR